jgi:putative heme-binding domain-containing protein
MKSSSLPRMRAPVPALAATPRVWVWLAAVAAIGAPASRSAEAQLVPDGFRCELILAAPEVEHPSAVTCDDQGNLFIGEDPMDMRGPPTGHIDRVLLLRWDAEGRPIKTVFADKLSAVFGLLWHDGWLYVLHAPYYSRLKDTTGDGVADVREDLITDLGVDGLVYVSVGDKGIPKATGRDGSTITLEGGGIIRMKPEGTELEIVSTGTRNHLDVAIDALDNLFTYDNTDDGLGWWTRFSHHVPTGYYGYPYDYLRHPERHLPQISEHGGGAPAGGACYLEAVWPEQYRGNAFFCEWGKGRVQRFTLTRRGATFDAAIADFLTNDGSGDLRPLDLCFSPDGRHMYLADWAIGGWLQPVQAGRVFRITYVGDGVPPEPPRARHDDPMPAQLRSLAHPAHSERMRAQYRLAAMGRVAIEPVATLLHTADAPLLARVHALWTLNLLADRVGGFDPADAWLAALGDADPDLRAQAARALGYRRVASAVKPLIAALGDEDGAVRLQATIGLGRIGDRQAVGSLCDALADPERFVQFTAMQALRAIGDWSLASEYLQADDRVLREQMILTLTGVYDDHAVAALAAAAASAADPNTRAAALRALAEVHRKADPYTGGWWGTMPARGEPARPKRHAWTGTEIVLSALRAALDSSEATVRLAAAESLLTIGDQPALAPLRRLAASDPVDEVRLVAIRAQAAAKDPAALEVLLEIARHQRARDAVRQEAVRAAAAIGSPEAVERLAHLTADSTTSDDLAVLALTALAQLKRPEALPAVESRLAAPAAPVRAAAIVALAAIDRKQAPARIARLLEDDPDPQVRRAALRALADLRAVDAVPAMIAAAADDQVRFEAIQALAAVPDARALPLYLDALVDRSPALREASRGALARLRGQIADEIVRRHQDNALSPEAMAELQIVMSPLEPIRAWQVIGPYPKPHQPEFDVSQAPDLAARVEVQGRRLAWQELTTTHPAGKYRIDHLLSPGSEVWAMFYTPIEVDTPGRAQIVFGSNDQCVLWLNGRKIFEFLGARGWNPTTNRLDIDLRSGVNHLWAMVGNNDGPWEFSLQVSRRDPKFAFLFEIDPPQRDPAVFRDYALQHAGDPQRGRAIFFDQQGAACGKCHVVAGQGQTVGPDLTDVGAKYPREELIRSVLDPSNRVADSYQVTIVITDDGRIHQGIVKSETDAALELLDAEGTRSSVSLMPSGLTQGMTPEDFADLIAYLESLKTAPAGQPAPPTK